jgi:tetratricopeptide (TPR) repeat protein
MASPLHALRSRHFDERHRLLRFQLFGRLLPRAIDARTSRRGWIQIYGRCPGHQRELSVTLERVATTQARLGDAIAALENCGRVVQIREELAARDPQHTGYQHDVALSLATMASMLEDCGDRDAAMNYYTRALRIAERLAAADPQHSGFQRAVAAILCDTAAIHLARGDEQAALDDCTVGLRVFTDSPQRIRPTMGTSVIWSPASPGQPPSRRRAASIEKPCGTTENA